MPIIFAHGNCFLSRMSFTNPLLSHIYSHILRTFGNASHSSEWADSPAWLSSYLLRSYSTQLQIHFASDLSRSNNADHSPLRVDFHPHDVDGSEANINTMW